MKIRKLKGKKIKDIHTWKLVSKEGNKRFFHQVEPIIIKETDTEIEIGEKDEQYEIEIEYEDGTKQVFDIDGKLEFQSLK